MRIWYLSYLREANAYRQIRAIKCLYNSLIHLYTQKKTKTRFQDQLFLNAGQKYCRMLQGEHSAILSTFVKLPFVIKIFVLSIFERPLKTGFIVW